VLDTYFNFLQNIERTLGGGRGVKYGLPSTLQKVIALFRTDAAEIRLNQPILAELRLPSQFGDFTRITSETPYTEAVITGAEGHLGTLLLYGSRQWSDNELRVVHLIAQQLGVALENATYFAQMKLQTSELRWIDKFGDSLLNMLSSLQIQEVAGRIMSATKDLLEVEEASIMLKDYESGDLMLWSHTPPEKDLSIRLKPGQGIAGWVVEYGKTAIVNDVKKDPRWEPAIDEKGGFDTRSVIAVPIILDGEIIGVIEGINKVNDIFDESDAQLLRTIAKWSAIGVGNANTYEALKHTTEQLADAKKQTAMAHMVLNLAHKINNSVGAVRVWAMEMADELKATPHPNTEMRLMVENVLHNAEETLLMVRRIRGATELRPGDIRPIEVIEAMETALQFSRVDAAVKVERHYEDGIPRVGADAERLVEVFLHLMNNATDVMNGRGTLTLTCRRAQNGTVEIMIQDDGQGIPDHLRSKIFDPFVTSKSDGLGLGLWMVKLYVELIGGKISVTSTAGKGTVFRITLPPWEK
jgi:signal transduction histidine kinase